MTIIHGDCLEVMKTFPDNHFTGIMTDPPYGLSFMGKGWDHAVPGRNYWESCLRVIKPGGFLLAMGGTRTSHRLASAIEDAGFDIRDTIVWVYGSGFPKSHNNFGLEGYGTALKPAFEPIIIAMKPIDGTFKQNYEKWGQAGINIDGCRIRSTEKWDSSGELKGGLSLGRYGDGLNNSGRSPSNDRGRWPANIIFDVEAAKMLDEQSGISKSLYTKRGNGIGKGFHGSSKDYDTLRGHQDSGGASRFFYCAKASSRERNEGLEGLPSIEGKRTQNGGDDTRGRPIPVNKNPHPTVKPLALMRYLIKLISPPTNALILDPFAGSGTTILAAKQLGIEAIGIEKQAEYVEIARKRLE